MSSRAAGIAIAVVVSILTIAALKKFNPVGIATKLGL